MSRLVQIALRDYIAYVRTPGFWLSIILVPIGIMVFGGSSALMARTTPIPTVAVVDFGALPQPPTALRAAPRLQAAQEPRLLARRIPELPGDHASAMPIGVFVWSAMPQIDVPAKAIHGLAADAAEA